MGGNAGLGIVLGRNDLSFPSGLLLPSDGLRRPGKGDFQHFLHARDRKDIERILQLVRYLREILGIFVRDDHRLDAGPERRKELLLEAADRQHPARAA